MWFDWFPFDVWWFEIIKNLICYNYRVMFCAWFLCCVNFVYIYIQFFIDNIMLICLWIRNILDPPGLVWFMWGYQIDTSTLCKGMDKGPYCCHTTLACWCIGCTDRGKKLLKLLPNVFFCIEWYYIMFIALSNTPTPKPLALAVYMYGPSETEYISNLELNCDKLYKYLKHNICCLILSNGSIDVE